MAETELLPISKIRIDGGTQSRVKLNQEVVNDYAEDLKQAGVEEDDRVAHPLPPGVAYYDGANYWLAAGFHRLHAHIRAGLEYMNVIVRNGSRHEAILFSVSDNAGHGLRRSVEDKRHSIRLLLSEPSWQGKSTRWIASHCKVTSYLVEQVRTEMAAEKGTPSVELDSVQFQDSKGNVREMDVTRLRKKKEPEQQPEESDTSGDETPADEIQNHFEGLPFDKFNADIRAGINTINSLVKSLKEVLGYDPKAKALKAPWAKHFTAESTIQPLQQVAKNLAECCPAEMDGDSYITVKQAAIRNKTVAA